MARGMALSRHREVREDHGAGVSGLVDGRDVVLRLAAAADALFEGFRPGVAERLGLA